MLSKQNVKPFIIGAAAITTGASIAFVAGGIILRRIKGEANTEIAKRIMPKRETLTKRSAMVTAGDIESQLLTDEERVHAELLLAGGGNTSIIGDDV